MEALVMAGPYRADWLVSQSALEAQMIGSESPVDARCAAEIRNRSSECRVRQRSPRSAGARRAWRHPSILDVAGPHLRMTVDASHDDRSAGDGANVT
ncbi:MAG: hypothetical protein E6G10_17375 [Actinobacteria bacterium]|nr:MAG: hypothetical protein E6G10_17375 [Actinomycetota bacterium]